MEREDEVTPRDSDHAASWGRTTGRWKCRWELVSYSVHLLTRWGRAGRGHCSHSRHQSSFDLVVSSPSPNASQRVTKEDSGKASGGEGWAKYFLWRNIMFRWYMQRFSDRTGQMAPSCVKMCWNKLRGKTEFRGKVPSSLGLERYMAPVWGPPWFRDIWAQSS